jgi:hypothetical protein
LDEIQRLRKQITNLQALQFDHVEQVQGVGIEYFRNIDRNSVIHRRRMKRNLRILSLCSWKRIVLWKIN